MNYKHRGAPIQNSELRIPYVHHVYRHQGSCLGAQARLAEGDGAEAVPDGQLHLFGAEVAFGAYEHEGILAGCEGLHERFLVALVAVGDELLPREGLGDELLERRHAIEHRQRGLERLLHGRHEYLLHAIGLHHLALRETALEEGELIEAYLGGLLGKPLDAVHVLRRGHSEVQMPLPQRRGCSGLYDAHIAALTADDVNLGTEERALAVGEHHLVAFGKAEHT